MSGAVNSLRALGTQCFDRRCRGDAVEPGDILLSNRHEHRAVAITAAARAPTRAMNMTSTVTAAIPMRYRRSLTARTSAEPTRGTIGSNATFAWS